jgi:DNA-binding CsgD family transcriptional regulator
MGAKTDYVRKKFAPLLDKTLEQALAHRIATEFPRIGGERICRLCAQMILEVLEGHLRPREQVRHGQMLWMAVDVNDPPARGKTISRTNLLPVVLDVHTTSDTEAILQRKPPGQRLLDKAVRLSRQAYEQGALLSNCDLAAILSCTDQRVSSLLIRHEERSQTIVPRRATTHDVGSGLTHKRIICLKRYRDGKPSHEIARETYHSIEAVDRYLGQYDRVRHCRQQGLSPEQTAFTLNCGPSLVREYIDIDRELEGGK